MAIGYTGDVFDKTDTDIVDSIYGMRIFDDSISLYSHRTEYILSQNAGENFSVSNYNTLTTTGTYFTTTPTLFILGQFHGGNNVTVYSTGVDFSHEDFPGIEIVFSTFGNAICVAQRRNGAYFVTLTIDRSTDVDFDQFAVSSTNSGNFTYFIYNFNRIETLDIHAYNFDSFFVDSDLRNQPRPPRRNSNNNGVSTHQIDHDDIDLTLITNINNKLYCMGRNGHFFVYNQSTYNRMPEFEFDIELSDDNVVYSVGDIVVDRDGITKLFLFGSNNGRFNIPITDNPINVNNGDFTMRIYNIEHVMTPTPFNQKYTGGKIIPSSIIGGVLQK